MDHPLPWLRYVDAGDLENDDELAGMPVESPTGEKLGHVDGFIVDDQGGRPYYVVVDAGGWFKSRHFLLPVGHTQLDSDTDRDALVADLPRERIDRFPGFDKDEFHRLSPADVKRINDETCQACGVTAITYSATEPYVAAWDRPDFRYPNWWSASPVLPERMGSRAFNEMADYPAATSPLSDPAIRDREQIIASDKVDRPENSREPGEPSPHMGGRAQPGDVLGVETGGETTSIGDTAEDENRRRRAAERDAPRK